MRISAPPSFRIPSKIGSIAARSPMSAWCQVMFGWTGAPRPCLRAAGEADDLVVLLEGVQEVAPDEAGGAGHDEAREASSLADEDIPTGDLDGQGPQRPRRRPGDGRPSRSKTPSWQGQR